MFPAYHCKFFSSEQIVADSCQAVRSLLLHRLHGAQMNWYLYNILKIDDQTRKFKFYRKSQYTLFSFLEKAIEIGALVTWNDDY